MRSAMLRGSSRSCGVVGSVGRVPSVDKRSGDVGAFESAHAASEQRKKVSAEYRIPVPSVEGILVA